MLWRRRCILLLRSRPRLLLLPFSSIHSLPPRPPPAAIDVSESDNHLLRRRRKLSLSRGAVQSALSSFPSDLIALSLFLRCAAQPGYSCNDSELHRMVGTLVRLTDVYKSVDGVVSQLEAVGHVVKAQTLLILMRIYWAGGLYELVIDAVVRMESFGFTHDTHERNMVMDLLFRIGRLDFSLEFLRQTRVPNFQTFNIALCHLCKMSDYLNARDVIREMLRRGFYPGQEAFEMMLSCLRSLRRLSEVSQVLAFMIVLGIPASVNVWSILIDGYCRLGRFDMAKFLLERMELTGCSPNIVTYSTLIKGYLKFRMVKDTLRLLRAMELKGIEPDLVLCNVLIDGFRRNRLYDHALHIYLSMPTWKLTPDSYTYSSLISVIIQSKRFSYLPRLMKGLDLNLDLVACNSLLNYLCKVGELSRAVDLYSDMVNAGLMVDNYSFAGLLYGLCGLRKIDCAVNTYHGIALVYPSVDAHVHTAIVHGLLQVGELDRAMSLFKKAVKENYPLDVVSYTIVIHGLLMAGASGEASCLFNKMKELGIYPNVYTYNAVVAGFCKEKDGKMVIRILKEMSDANIPLIHDSFDIVQNFLSRSCYGKLAAGLIVEVRDALLLPPMPPPSFSRGLYAGVHVDDMYYSYVGRASDKYSSTDTSCSEDIWDVAASVC